MPSSLGSITLDASRHVGRMTLRVQIRGATRTWLRCRVARYWLAFGAWIIGCQFYIDSEEDNN